MILRIALLVIFTAFGSGAYAKDNPLSIGGKQDRHTPIEVTSDTLEVMQEQNQAVFSGHVVAIQGNVRLKADKMTVTYAKQEEKKTGKKSKGKDSGQNAIKKIDAEGSVFLSTAEETASGGSGVYDVEHQEILLSDHVVLTRGQNTLKGDKLTYNFATGKSMMSGGAETPAGGKKERVRALFVPDSKDSEKQ